MFVSKSSGRFNPPSFSADFFRDPRAQAPSTKSTGKTFPDFETFLCQHVYIKDHGGTKFEPWAWQRDIARAFSGLKRVQFLKARQLGMSWVLAAYALHTALSHPGAEVLLMSQTEPDAMELLGKCKFVYDHMPEHLRELRKQSGRDNTKVLEFADIYSAIRALPSTERAGRGFTGKLVVGDEHAFHQWAEQNMAAVDPVIEAGGQFVSLSSANGIGNLFHNLWAKGTQSREPLVPEWVDGLGFTYGGRLQEAAATLQPSAWLPVFLPYNVRPGRDAQWWEFKKQNTTPAWVIFQEYPREAEEAFVQTGRPVFAKEYLDPHKLNVREPLPPAHWPAAFAAWKPEELRLFSLPVAGHRYVAGADVAEGLEHGDYSCLTVFDRDAEGKPEQVLSLHGHWPPDEFAKLIDAVARLYPGTYGIERNNHGLATILKLQELQTPGLYREAAVQTKPGQAAEQGKVGWTTSSVTKPLMIDDLEEGLRTFGLALRDALCFPELTFYQTKPNGATGAPVGQWDDRVIMLAIALQMLKRAPRPREIWAA